MGLFTRWPFRRVPGRKFSDAVRWSPRSHNLRTVIAVPGQLADHNRTSPHRYGTRPDRRIVFPRKWPLAIVLARVVVKPTERTTRTGRLRCLRTHLAFPGVHPSAMGFGTNYRGRPGLSLCHRHRHRPRCCRRDVGTACRSCVCWQIFIMRDQFPS